MMEGAMKVMSRTVVVPGLVACVGCASMDNSSSTTTPDAPVGTTGTTPSGPVQVDSAKRGLIPVGQELDARLQTTLNSSSATVEQRFEATTVVDLKQGDAVLVPAGSTVRGLVSRVEPAGKIDRSGSLTLAFDRLVVNGREYPIRAMATQVFESRGIREEAGTVGTAGAVGAIVGGIIGGLKGALIGAVVGSGGVIAATDGKNVELPAGTIVRVRMDSPVQTR
jgi:hypothetical protein